MATDWKTYLKTQGAVYEEELLTGFSKVPHALGENAVSVLSGQNFIKVDGTDRQKFLQGQISTHMVQLAAHHFSTGVACSPKGRMYTNFKIMDNGEDYLLCMNSDLIETTMETLKKYAVFFKVNLTNQPDYVALGLSGANTNTILTNIFPDSSLPEQNEVINVSSSSYLMKAQGNRPRYELWLHQDDLPLLWPELTKELTPATEDFWELLNIESVIPELRQETIDKYIPQHLNQPSLGGVSFRKGCYTGQEIVTRMQNLGQQKSRCYWLTLDNAEEPDINTRLYNSASKPVGEVIQRVRNIENNNFELLAVIRIEAAEANDVFLDAEQSHQLEVHEIPYVIDPKAELQK
ncbi:YgfZ/GcvT domain-containing protein [Endozoicomonas sp.]|uniref:CAF17-like 4Fe-4S cluster assembly/insertion protein YgfZ n=1 Tax=Endozoicomonas sp. TaxID=1892382 RepID=UPI003AF75AB3